MSEEKNVQNREIQEEMTASYIDYAMSVIIGRALPDVRDGLKPVHRRVLYSMRELGLLHNKPTMKSARIVGDCLGKYHPHGDMAVYDTLVRMAQDFSMRYPLVVGQGNFGSIDGDSPAAMRYTEAKLSKIAEEMLQDLDKESVDFTPNFDGTLKEPTVLPAKLPNLLINGSSGIAVGMATNIPPHNLKEVADAIVAVLDNPGISVKELCSIIKGPDFPTGGIIYGRNGILNAYLTGNGKVIIRGKTEFEEKKNRKAIVIKEIPFAVQKSLIVESIADAVRDKKILGISDIRDESNKEGIRIVLELKQDANEEFVLNQLYAHTQLQSNFGIIMLAIVDGSPKVLNIKQIIEHFISHRKNVIERRTRYDLKKAEERKHILDGLIIAIQHIEEVVQKIKSAKGTEAALEVLQRDYALTEIQARAILDMKLQRLSSLERERLILENEEVTSLIKRLKEILSSESEIIKIIKEETLTLKREYGDERRTEIVDVEDSDSVINYEDTIKRENTVITISKDGYIKRTSLSEFRLQKRGGKGLIGANKKEEDLMELVRVVNTHSDMLFFTNLGRAYRIKAYEIPESERNSRGRPVVNFMNLSEGEKISEMIEVPEFSDGKFIILATSRGIIKRSSLSEYDSRRESIKAIILDDKDFVVGAAISDGNMDIVLTTREGLAARFKEEEVRCTGRVARGVTGIKLGSNDSVIDLCVATPEKCLLSVTEKGFGKRTFVSEYRLTGRAVKGVRNIRISQKTGLVAGVKEVEDGDELLLITKEGSSIRFPAVQASLVGRNAQGVRLIKLEPNDIVVSVAKISREAVSEAQEDKENDSTKNAN